MKRKIARMELNGKQLDGRTTTLFRIAFWNVRTPTVLLIVSRQRRN